MQYRESEFYAKLLELIDLDLSEKGLKPVDLMRINYIISRSQYYNIRGIAMGNMEIPRLSHNRLMGLCEYLGIDLYDILYEVRRIRPRQKEY